MSTDHIEDHPDEANLPALHAVPSALTIAVVVLLRNRNPLE